jgi:MraZ protein
LEAAARGDWPVIRRFRGESVHKVDQKGRVSVPAAFRRVLEEGDPDWTEGLNPNLVLVYGGPGGRCLEGYTIAGIARIDDKISRMPTFSKARKALERWLNTQSVYAQVDENGRMVLPARLRELVGLEEEALFAGMGDRFQVWAPAGYADDMAALDDWRSGLGEDEDPFAQLDAMDSGGGGA